MTNAAWYEYKYKGLQTRVSSRVEAITIITTISRYEHMNTHETLDPVVSVHNQQQIS